MKRKIIVGNWKMGPTHIDEARRIVKTIKRVVKTLKNIDVVICPPFTYIQVLSSHKGPSILGIGAQDVYFEQEGSFTGEISSTMLKDLGVNYVIVGHAERRKMGETDAIISKKIKALLDIGLKPILCVGEIERDQQVMYLDILRNQIKSSLSGIPKKMIKDVILAYEPVWAIGAKEPMQTESIQEMIIFVRKVLADLYGQDNAVSVPILYGGAVNFRNAADIVKIGEADGLLVGRESINTPGFVELLKAVELVA